MRICIDNCVVQFSEITKEWSSDLISLQDLLIGIVVMWFWLAQKIFFNLVEEWIEDRWKELQWIFNYEFIRNSLFFTFFCFSCVLRAFFFEGLWWKFFGALETWICRASLIYGLLRFFEAFELDSSKL